MIRLRSQDFGAGLRLSYELQQLAIGIDEDRLIAALKQMAHPPLFLIHPAGIARSLGLRAIQALSRGSYDNSIIQARPWSDPQIKSLTSIAFLA